MTGIFVNYRKAERSYAPMFAAWVLRQRFGTEYVFEAWEKNRPGTYFPDSIDRWLDRCSLLLVFIDQPWLQDLDRLRDPEDWVRREIRHFIEWGKPILPILLDGVQMPSSALMPEELVPLTKWIALPMSAKTVHADMQRLVGKIERMMPDLVLMALTEQTSPGSAIHPPPASPAALLRAEHEVFPFRRRPELVQLIDWCLAPDGPPARLVIGPSGTGKTRLALRLCAQLRASQHPAGMVPASATPAALLRLGEATVPCLVVIDDAETRPEVVAAAMRALATSAASTRVLLLARMHGDWLEHLRDDLDDRLVSLLDGIVVTELSPPVPMEDDFETAQAAIGAQLGLRDLPPPRKEAPRPATLLELQAAALADLLPDGTDAATPWQRIADIERSRWHRMAAVLGLARLRREHLTEIMAMVTLFGAATDPEEEALIAGLRCFAGMSKTDVDAGRTLVRTMLPGPTPLNPIEPQPLADEIITQLLRSRYRLSGILGAVTDDQARTALIALGRCLAAHPGISEAVGALLNDAPARLLPLAMTAAPAVPAPAALVALLTGALRHVPTADLDRLTNALPQRSEALAGFAVDVTERALAAHRTVGRANLTTARLSRLLAIRLAYRGERAAEAVEEARRAVRWFEAADLEDGRAELAEAHAALALALDLDPASAGEACAAGRQAIGIFRATATDARIQGALATALIDQVRRLHATGAVDEAPAMAVEACQILHRLSEARPARYRSLYADATDLLAALTHSEQLGREALRLRRELARARPDAYRPQLAATLFNLGLILTFADDARDEIRELWRESAELFAELAAADPKRFGRDRDRVRDRLENIGT